ncbi:hypothetical protein RYX36_001105, partial [Vicia faba]
IEAAYSHVDYAWNTNQSWLWFVQSNISIDLTPQSWDLKTMTKEHGLTELCRFHS